MNITPDQTSMMNQDINHHHNSTNGNTRPDQPPPPYSPTSCPHDEERVPSYNPACVSDADHPSAPSLYPEIPQRLPVEHQQPQQQHYYPQQQQLNMQFPVPQPYIQEQAIYHPHSSTPFYHHHHQQGYNQYGTISHNNNTNPHLPASPPPAGFHTIHLPPQGHPGFLHHHQSSEEEDMPAGRCFPVGALVFIFGWIFPPLFVLGICCASSRHANERWWARLNLTMALLLLLSSILYSMFGPADALLALLAFKQEN